MLRYILLILLCYVQHFARGQNCLENLSKANCLKFLAAYQEFWKADSFAQNGSREIIGTEFLRHFRSLEGSDWSEIVSYLGKPHFTFKNVQRFIL